MWLFKQVFCSQDLTALRWLYPHVSINKHVIPASLLPIYFFCNPGPGRGWNHDALYGGSVLEVMRQAEERHRYYKTSNLLRSNSVSEGRERVNLSLFNTLPFTQLTQCNTGGWGVVEHLVSSDWTALDEVIWGAIGGQNSWVQCDHFAEWNIYFEGTGSRDRIQHFFWQKLIVLGLTKNLVLYNVFLNF